MASTRRIATLAVALFLFFSLPAAGAQAPAKTADPDSAAIKQVIADFSANFSRHDAHAMALAFAEDGDLTNMYGILLHGRTAIEERLAALFSGILRSAHRTDSVRSIRFFTPQVALLDADTLISGTKAPDGSDLPDRKGLLIAVLTRQHGRWLLSNLHEAEFPRPAPVINPQTPIARCPNLNWLLSFLSILQIPGGIYPDPVGSPASCFLLLFLAFFPQPAKTLAVGHPSDTSPATVLVAQPILAVLFILPSPRPASLPCPPRLTTPR